MATFAQLEVIGPGGSVEFYNLDQPQGVANIGRHPDNDIVIDSPNVAPFHAVLDYRQWPYQIILLSEQGQTTLEGQQLAANSRTSMDNWNTVRVDGYNIILLQGDAMPPIPQPGAPMGAPLLNFRAWCLRSIPGVEARARLQDVAIIVVSGTVFGLLARTFVAEIDFRHGRFHFFQVEIAFDFRKHVFRRIDNDLLRWRLRNGTRAGDAAGFSFG